MRDLLDRRRRAGSLAGVDLEEVRLDCGFTQETIAAGLGISRATVSSYERRTRRPTEAYCRVMAAFMRHLEVTR